MAIYLDSAVLEEARQACSLGWVYGVTTNPTLMAKAGVKPEAVLRGLAELDFHRIYYQLVSSDLADMLAEACTASELIKKGLVLKIPPTQNGFRFITRHGTHFPCCVTAIFDPAQALVARESGAKYVAVYVNRATKQLGSGLALVEQLAAVLAGSETEIVAASLKSARDAVDAFLAGAQHITVSLDVLMSLHTHPLSVQAVDQFEAEGVGLPLKS